MTLNWSSLKEECPLAVQLIERHTDHKYDPAYGTLLNLTKDPVTYAHMEGFFDDHGWFMSIIPTEFPGWNGIISDTTGKILLNDPLQFKDVASRNHAKSLLAGIAIKFFEEQAKPMFAVPEGGVVLESEFLRESAKDTALEHLTYENLNHDGMGLMASSDFLGLKIGNRIKVFKNTEELPYIDMIIYA